MKKIFALIVFGMATTAMVSFAQDGGGRGGKGGGANRPVPPVIAALDENGDKTIDAKEIADAPQNLKNLDKNNDGKLTSDELMPPRPDAPAAAEGDKKPAEGAAPAPRRPSPFISALDANGDGVIDEKEMAAASESLKKLDKNSDGQIAPDEARPARAAQGEKKAEGEKKSKDEKTADKADAKAPEVK